MGESEVTGEEGGCGVGVSHNGEVGVRGDGSIIGVQPHHLQQGGVG